VSASQSVEVCLDLEALGGPVRMGDLNRQLAGSGEILSFEYDGSWLSGPAAFAFDPDLALVAGRQYPAANRQSFGIFMDSSPDRWGRVLMERREALRAVQEGRRRRKLTDWDFLLGVHDLTRLGALRFRQGSNHHFLDNEPTFAVPPLSSLRELQAASLSFEEHLDELDHPDYAHWLSQLLAPGSSLGGARPKASVLDEHGNLCIAKFPSRQDRRDVGAWELVANRLAARAGIDVPETRPSRLGDSPYTTFVAKRFDRTGNGGRLAFVSAMTLTQRSDGEPGASYLELVDLLQSRGANTEADCEQLFRRVVFNILIHNTDDHLRNHGFFVDARGIRLSPAYDLNPTIGRGELSLAIDEVHATCDVAIALDARRDYGLDGHRAERVVAEVEEAVSHWRAEARYLGISRSEQELMVAAFAAGDSVS
jgi:serine/threonine-protein kinase HipA